MCLERGPASGSRPWIIIFGQKNNATRMPHECRPLERSWVSLASTRTVYAFTGRNLERFEDLKVTLGRFH